jgi:hypothetical protein
MPAKKKNETEAPAAAPKPVKRAVKKVAAPAAAKVEKPKKPAAATAAATHKAPAKRAEKLVDAKFDVNAHRGEIEYEAYLLWASRGHEHGQAHEDWLKAIEIVKSRKN